MSRVQDDAFAALLEEMQMRDSLSMYNRLVERCFTDCVENFRTTKLDQKEHTCLSRCVDKFLKHSQRSGVRFAESQPAPPPS
mmetsp:Transcript_44028/g.71672  ORF Transcript_44028/g.71672 Transcript_44028/m.71672 type:complete len:82 (+) Transcript_44028:123-368(+)